MPLKIQRHAYVLNAASMSRGGKAVYTPRARLLIWDVFEAHAVEGACSVLN